MSKLNLDDKIYTDFINKLNPNIILTLSDKFIKNQIKGKITHKIFIKIMEENFSEENNNKDYKDLFELIFNRFKTLKCWMIGNKETFFITKLVHEDTINIYDLMYGLAIYMKCEYKEKIKVLFKLTDNDDDGLISKQELIKLISIVNYIFSEEESPIHTGSSILCQSITTLKIKEAIDLLLNEPGNLNNNFENELFIDFPTFYSSLIKIKGYKFKIIPCFINIKISLNTHKNEKIINLKRKNKDDFFNISSEIINHIDPKKKQNKFSFNTFITKDTKKDKELHKKFGTIKVLKTPKIPIRLRRRGAQSSINLLNYIPNLKKFPPLYKKFENFDKYKFNINFDKIQNIEAKPGIIEIEERKDDMYNRNYNFGNNLSSLFKYSNKSRSNLKAPFYKTFNQTIEEINSELNIFEEGDYKKDIMNIQKKIKGIQINVRNNFIDCINNSNSTNFDFYKVKHLRKNKSI